MDKSMDRRRISTMQKSLCFFVFIKSEYEMLKGFTSLYLGWYVLQ